MILTVMDRRIENELVSIVWIKTSFTYIDSLHSHNHSRTYSRSYSSKGMDYSSLITHNQGDQIRIY